MKKILCVLICFVFILLTSCSQHERTSIIGGADGPTQIIISKEEENKMYKQITQQEAKNIMDSNEDFIILDVREQEEFDEGHIPGAILISYTQIYELAKEKLPDKNQQILVYCRSGRRSKIAAQSLAELGYTNVKEFGGILDWPYEIER